MVVKVGYLQLKSRIQATKRKYLCRVKGVTRKERICNEAITEDLNIEPVLKTIEKQQRRWFGYICRLESNIPAKMIDR